MKGKFLVLTAVVFSSKLLAQLAPNPQRDTVASKVLDEVVVTATRFQQKQSTTGKVVSVIDEATLQRSVGRTLTEIINTQAGVFINGANNNLGTNQDVYLRGAGTGNTLVLIDGVPVSDPSQIANNFDLNSIAPGQLERIEILKGAQSTLWGSDAVAGVINLITKKGGASKFNGNALLSYGSYNTLRGSTAVSGKLNKFNYNIGYNFTGSNGFSTAQDTVGNRGFDKDGFGQNNVQANVGYAFSKRFSAKALYSFGRYNTAADAGAFRDDKDYNATNTNNFGNVEFVYAAEKIKLHFTQSFVTAKRVFTDDSGSIGGFAKFSRANYEGRSNISELFANITLGKKVSLVSGMQYLGQNTAQDFFSLSSFGPFATALGDSAKIRNFSVYNSLLVTNANGFNFEAGFRYNHHSIYGGNATFTINPSYNIDAQTRVFVNISSAYKTPSLYQLYSEFGNKNLNPESSINYEVGVQAYGANQANSIRIVGFKRNINDLIVFFTNPSTFNSVYINRDEQNDFGFEIESTIGLGKLGSWNNNISYVDGSGRTNGREAKNLFRRPNFVLNSTITLEVATGFTIMPGFRFVGTRLKGQFDAGPTTQPQYYNFDCYLGYSFAKNWRLFADLRNITNQTYFDVVGFNSRRFNFMTGLSCSF
ncbi:MAG: TonB-dependent receptor [Bacteroidetes bacterium]|nr:MAG: TonB-dependent receptor [Bacteroidota bacterium]